MAAVSDGPSGGGGGQVGPQARILEQYVCDPLSDLMQVDILAPQKEREIRKQVGGCPLSMLVVGKQRLQCGLRGLKALSVGRAELLARPNSWRVLGQILGWRLAPLVR